MKEDPAISVSVLMVTYNHENFISHAIESVLMQKTSFPFELVIGEDCSTDKTREIVIRYAQNYPLIVKALLPPMNLGIRQNSLNTFKECKGKYLAFLDGDDYWTDSNKLQKQVDFLEANPDYSICVGGFTELSNGTLGKTIVIKDLKQNDQGRNGFTFGLKEMQKKWITKTLTAVIRNDVFHSIDFTVYKYIRDIHFFYHSVKNHKGFYFTEVFGVFRIHEGSVNSMKQGRVNSNAAYNCYRELYENNRDEFTRIMAYFNTLALLNYNLYNKYPGNTLGKNLKLFNEALRLTRKPKEVKYLFSAFIPSEYKDRL